MAMVLMSRTVRYFKLLYIVAGILLSNEEICDKIDRIEITPRMVPEVKQMMKLQPRQMCRTVSDVSTSWVRRAYLYGLHRVKRHCGQLLGAFNIWALPQYVLDRVSQYISKQVDVNSDCDLIYNK